VNLLDARLLRALREATVHLPTSEVAAQLGATVADVRAQVAELQGAGFELEDRPGLGLRLLAAPDRLLAADLAARLGDSTLVREFTVFEETDSTNDLALQRGRQGAAGGLAIFAERQTAGRGRFGRRWESASHRGLWFTLLLRPDFPLAQWSRLTTWAAAGVAAAVESATGLPAAIKWPNDVFLGGRKVAGILIESGTDREGRHFAAVGIGVNANHEAADFPPELIERASSLRLATGRLCDRAALAVAILTELAARHALLAADFPQLVTEASRRSLLLGRWVQLRSGPLLHEGLAESLDADGQLCVRGVDGTATSFVAGEVTVVGQGFP